MRMESGLKFPEIDPVAVWLGPLPVRWYALAYIAGIVLGWFYALYLAGLDKDRRPGKEDIDDFVPWAIAGIILGGRLGYILFYNFETYMADPLSVFKVWQGGMSFHGGALGVITALTVYPFVKKIEHLRLADIVCAAVPIGLLFGRIANFINGELYGRATDVAWAVRFPGGGYIPRHPSQLYEALLEGLVLFLILFAMMRMEKIRNRPGFVSGAFLFGYGAFRAALEYFREPDAQIGLIGDVISMGQILSLPMILAGAGLMIYAFKRTPKA